MHGPDMTGLREPPPPAAPKLLCLQANLFLRLSAMCRAEGALFLFQCTMASRLASRGRHKIGDIQYCT
jgi:hypothetical protein